MSRLFRHTVGRLGPLLAAVALLFAPASAAAEYPDQPVRILVGFTPGVAPDVTARLLADKFSRDVGQAGPDRERHRRRQQHRHRPRRQVAAGRLHAADGRQFGDRHQPEPV